MSKSRGVEIVQAPAKADIVRASGANRLLAQVRPEWQARSLIQRVNNLLPVDPSSACQRLFNAAIQDLRQKILVGGLDIAREAAERDRLPQVSRPEDILEEYSTSRVIDLAYRMGILTRPEWRRVTRCYEIRRDLEHEDDQYEAEVEDVIYIFKTCTEVILSRDPIQPLRLADVEKLIESPEPAVAAPEFLAEYEAAPEPRQLRIIEYLVNTALDSRRPDILRQNAVEALRVFSPITRTPVKIELGQMLQARIGRDRLELVVAKVAAAAGILPYLKQRQTRQFFGWMLDRFKATSYHWRQFDAHGDLLDDLEDIGGLNASPDDIRRELILWMTLCFLGEPGGYGTLGRNRPVFYSDTAAPKIRTQFAAAGRLLAPDLEAVANDDRVKAATKNEYIARRYEKLVDVVAGEMEGPT